MRKYTIDINDNINNVIEKILTNGQRTVIVLKEKKVAGIISEGDILKSMIYKKTFNSTLSSIMNKNFKYLKHKDYQKNHAKKIFLKELCHLIPVVDKNLKLKNVITLQDFLQKEFNKKK
tara:strand:- start:2476 stop:2832 length:357 start_codon:yes stop_codon:yes gene_type:complete